MVFFVVLIVRPSIKDYPIHGSPSKRLKVVCLYNLNSLTVVKRKGIPKWSDVEEVVEDI